MKPLENAIKISPFLLGNLRELNGRAVFFWQLGQSLKSLKFNFLLFLQDIPRCKRGVPAIARAPRVAGPGWGPAPPIAAHPKKFRTPARPAHTCGSGHAPSPGEHRPPGRGRGAALPHRPCLYGRFAVLGPPVPPRRSGAPSLCLYGAGRRGHVARAGRKRRERRLNEAGPVSAGVTPPSRRAGGCRDSPVA